MTIMIGLTGCCEELVTEEKTARAVGSGALPVYGTPCMLALIEQAACKALEGALEEGQTSVGTLLNVQHLAATPVGMHVRAEAIVTAVDGRKITFSVKTVDEAGVIGGGIHERFLVNAEKFVAKCYAKQQQ